MRRLRICTPLCLILVYVGVVRGDAGLLQVTEFRNQSLEAYPEIANRVVAGWTIPGLDAGFVPQGIATIPDTDLILLSGYRGLSYQARWIPARRWPFVRRLVRVGGKQSVLILVRHPEGIPVRAGLLEYQDGRPMGEHAGGIAVWGGYIWIPSEFNLYRFPLEALIQAREDIVPVRSDHAPIAVDSLGAFISTYGDVLLIGDYARRGSHPVPAHHAAPDGSHRAWTAVYYMDAATGLPASTNRYAVDKRYTVLRPDAVLHHRERAQGIAVPGRRERGLSLSYGSEDSEIAFYRLGDSQSVLHTGARQDNTAGRVISNSHYGH